MCEIYVAPMEEWSVVVNDPIGILKNWGQEITVAISHVILIFFQ